MQQWIKDKRDKATNLDVEVLQGVLKRVENRALRTNMVAFSFTAALAALPFGGFRLCPALALVRAAVTLSLSQPGSDAYLLATTPGDRADRTRRLLTMSGVRVFDLRIPARGMFVMWVKEALLLVEDEVAE